MVDEGRVLATVGTVAVVSSLWVLYLASPWDVTSVVAIESGGEWPTDRVAEATADVRDPIAFSNLSAPEQTALERALRRPARRYADRGASENGSTFTTVPTSPRCTRSIARARSISSPCPRTSTT